MWRVIYSFIIFPISQVEAVVIDELTREVAQTEINRVRVRQQVCIEVGQNICSHVVSQMIAEIATESYNQAKKERYVLVFFSIADE